MGPWDREGNVRFRNRHEVATLLAERLEHYRGQRPLVLGIPRGGVPMAATIATALAGDLDVVLVHKLRAPFQPELAVGAVDEAGRVYLAPFARQLGLEDEELEVETQAQLSLLRERRARYSAVRPAADPAGRTVILVDEGLATGSTAIAAVRAMRAKGAARVVVAIGVAPPETVRLLERAADEVVCLHSPDVFGAVGAFFDDFSEVTDDEVIVALAKGPPGTAGPLGPGGPGGPSGAS
jgi:putative phosphoribosyl transferase